MVPVPRTSSNLVPRTSRTSNPLEPPRTSPSLEPPRTSNSPSNLSNPSNPPRTPCPSNPLSLEPVPRTVPRTALEPPRTPLEPPRTSNPCPSNPRTLRTLSLEPPRTPRTLLEPFSYTQRLRTPVRVSGDRRFRDSATAGWVRERDAGVGSCRRVSGRKIAPRRTRVVHSC